MATSITSPEWGSLESGGVRMSSMPAQTSTNCSECGRLIDVESHFCLYCGHELPGEEEKTDLEREVATREKPGLPILGGSFIIASSVFLFVTLYLVMDLENEPSDWWAHSVLDVWPDWLIWLMAIFGIVGIIGGISAMARRSQTLAIVGGLLSSFGIGMVLGIIGLALVAASEKEFKSALTDFTEPQEGIDSRTLDKSTLGWRR